MTGDSFGLTNRDYAVLLLDGIDLEAQLLAVRSLLRRHANADAQLQSEIEELAKRAREAQGEYGMHLTDSWVDEMHGSVFQDAAHSMAAIGMLAPLVESLFVGIFRGIRDIAPPVKPVTPTGARAAYVADRKFWDPHYVFGGRRSQKDIVRGIQQLVDSTGLTPFLPGDYAVVLDALFKYRNKMLHQGFEWPPAERANFEAMIVRERWPSAWFERSLTNGETWIIYMSDVLISLALARIDQMLDGIGLFIQSRYPSAPAG